MGHSSVSCCKEILKPNAPTQLNARGVVSQADPHSESLQCVRDFQVFLTGFDSLDDVLTVFEGTGKIDRERFEKCVVDSGFTGDASLVFNTLDTEGSGSLSTEEIRKQLELIDEQCKTEKLTKRERRGSKFNLGEADNKRGSHLGAGGVLARALLGGSEDTTDSAKVSKFAGRERSEDKKAADAELDLLLKVLEQNAPEEDDRNGFHSQPLEELDKSHSPGKAPAGVQGKKTMSRDNVRGGSKEKDPNKRSSVQEPGSPVASPKGSPKNVRRSTWNAGQGAVDPDSPQLESPKTSPGGPNRRRSSKGRSSVAAAKAHAAAPLVAAPKDTSHLAVSDANGRNPSKTGATVGMDDAEHSIPQFSDSSPQHHADPVGRRFSKMSQDADGPIEARTFKWKGQNIVVPLIQIELLHVDEKEKQAVERQSKGWTKMKSLMGAAVKLDARRSSKEKGK